MFKNYFKTALRNLSKKKTFSTIDIAALAIGLAVCMFTAFTVLIASPGLFGLAAFTAAQRTKEIGTQKAFGASVQSVEACYQRNKNQKLNK